MPMSATAWDLVPSERLQRKAEGPEVQALANLACPCRQRRSQDGLRLPLSVCRRLLHEQVCGALTRRER